MSVASAPSSRSARCPMTGEHRWYVWSIRRRSVSGARGVVEDLGAEDANDLGDVLRRRHLGRRDGRSERRHARSLDAALKPGGCEQEQDARAASARGEPVRDATRREQIAARRSVERLAAYVKDHLAFEDPERLVLSPV